MNNKIVATSVSLDDFKQAFLGSENFLTMPCWKYVTHLVVKDFLNIATADGAVVVAGLSDRFGWTIYKSLLRKLVETYPHLTLLLEFHEVINRDLLYGSLKFPCCKVAAFVSDNFPAGSVGLCMRVLNYISVVNIETGLGASLNCVRVNLQHARHNSCKIWADIENPHFYLSKAQAAYFDGVFVHKLSKPKYPLSTTVLKIVNPFSDAKIAFAAHAGMMTRPIFQDGSDATMVDFATAQLDKLREPSMFNTCLKHWRDLAANPCAACSKCVSLNSICAAQSNAPGSCSTEKAKTGTVVSADSEAVAGMIFLLDD